MAAAVRVGLAAFVSLALSVADSGFAVERCLPLREREAQTEKTGTVCQMLVSGGRERTYRLYAEPRTDGAARPIILVLHGGAGSGIGAEWLTLGRFNSTAGRAGALIVYPDGYRRQWNDGRPDVDSEAHQLDIDDSAFLTDLINALGREFPIDAARIYAAGISNGGMMALRLACEHAERFAAIAVIAAAQPSEVDCEPQSAVSAVIVAGTDDPLVPYGGGAVRALGKTRGVVRSVQETVGFWVRHNECLEPPTAVEYADRDPDDGTEIVHSLWSACRDQTAVAFYAVKGGGHLWPGGRIYAGERLIGRATTELDATAVVTAFFASRARHPAAR